MVFVAATIRLFIKAPLSVERAPWPRVDAVNSPPTRIRSTIETPLGPPLRAGSSFTSQGPVVAPGHYHLMCRLSARSSTSVFLPSVHLPFLLVTGPTGPSPESFVPSLRSYSCSMLKADLAFRTSSFRLPFDTRTLILEYSIVQLHLRQHGCFPPALLLDSPGYLARPSQPSTRCSIGV